MKTLSPLGHFLFGSVMGAGICALVLVHVFTSRIETENAHAAESLARIHQEYSVQIKVLHAALDDVNAAVESCKSRAAAMEAPESQMAAFTLLYDSSAAAPSPGAGSPLQLLDLVRPGLGTMLARMQSSQRPAAALPSSPPRWLVPGLVRPVVNGNPAGMAYYWILPQTNTVEMHRPESVTLTPVQ